MATYSFVMMTHFLSDAVGLLAVLSKIMQKENVTFSFIQNNVEGTTVALEALLTVDGPHTKKAKQDLPCTPDGSDFLHTKAMILKIQQGNAKNFKKQLYHSLENW